MTGGKNTTSSSEGYELYSDDMYCNDYGEGSSGDYYSLESCFEFV